MGRELALVLLLVLLADVLTSDARQYATRIFPILDPVTGARREAHPPGRPADPSPLVPWQPVAPAVILTGKDFNWVVPQDHRVKIIPR